MIICGYCEIKNNNDTPSCLSCGGALSDEITQRRNEVVTTRWCLDPLKPNGFIKLGETGHTHNITSNAMYPDSIVTGRESTGKDITEVWTDGRITVDEAYKNLMSWFR